MLYQGFRKIVDSQLSKPPLVIPFSSGDIGEDIFRRPEDCGLWTVENSGDY